MAGEQTDTATMVGAEDGEPPVGDIKLTPEAKESIHAATDGIPRLINVLCDNALLIGYARGVHEIDKLIVADVLRDMTCWNLHVPAGPSDGDERNQASLTR